MKIRSANRGGSDLDNHVGRFLDLGIRNRIHSDIVFAVPTKCSHKVLLLDLTVCALYNPQIEMLARQEQMNLRTKRLPPLKLLTAVSAAKALT
jgi:hypothetical protein